VISRFVFNIFLGTKIGEEGKEMQMRRKLKANPNRIFCVKEKRQQEVVVEIFADESSELLILRRKQSQEEQPQLSIIIRTS
jgi:hypothetical protein